MAKKRASAVVAFPNDPKIIASVATTPRMIILSFGDGREEHWTYPPDGRFHVTPHDPSSSRSYIEPGPAYEDLAYHPLDRVRVPHEPSQISRNYRASRDEIMTIPPPRESSGTLEVGILGQQATSEVVESLHADTASVNLFPGPRSDTTIVFRYLP